MKRETTAEYIRSAKILFRLFIGTPALKDTAGLTNDAELESGYGRGVKQGIKIIYNPAMDRGGVGIRVGGAGKGRVGPNPRLRKAWISLIGAAASRGQAKKDFRTPDEHRGMDQGRGIQNAWMAPAKEMSIRLPDFEKPGCRNHRRE